MRPSKPLSAMVFIIALLTLVSGCDDGEDVTRATAEDGVFTIDDEADPITTESGLVIYHVEEGAGPQPADGNVVSVHYTGMLADGSIFDSSYPRGGPIRFVLGRGSVIAGWDEGIALMNRGGKARLIIPPQLGYGSAGAGGGVIPPDATLTFDVWLVDVD